MRNIFLVTLLLLISLLSSCDDNTVISNTSSIIEAQLSDDILKRCPTINYIRSVDERGVHGVPNIEVCYLGRMTVWTSYELFYRSSGSDNEKDWKSLGTGYDRHSYNELPGGCEHVYYDISLYDGNHLEYNRSYEFKAGSTSELLTPYLYFHYEHLNSEYHEYEKRKVYLTLNINPPVYNWKTYTATIVMKENSVNDTRIGIQSVEFTADFGQTIHKTSQTFEAAFYCQPITSPYGQNMGTIDVSLASQYEYVPIVRTKTFGYDYSSRSVVMDISW